MSESRTDAQKDTTASFEPVEPFTADELSEMSSGYPSLSAEITALRAEIARLRKALRDIANGYEVDYAGVYSFNPRRMAREALKEATE